MRRFSLSFQKFWFLYINSNIPPESFVDPAKINLEFGNLKWIEILNENKFINLCASPFALLILATMGENKIFQKSFRELPFEKRYRILDSIEKNISEGTPFSLLEDIKIPNPYFSISHYWIFGLGHSFVEVLLKTSVGKLTEVDLTGIDDISFESSIHKLLLSYGYKENYLLLDFLYANQSLIDICRDVDNFLINFQKENWLKSIILDNIVFNSNEEYDFELLPSIGSKGQIKSIEELQADLIGYIQRRFNTAEIEEKLEVINLFLPSLSNDPLQLIASDSHEQLIFNRAMDKLISDIIEVIFNEQNLPYIKKRIDEAKFEGSVITHITHLHEIVLSKLAKVILNTKREDTVFLIRLYLLPNSLESKKYDEYFPQEIVSYIVWYFSNFNDNSNTLTKLFTLESFNWEYSYLHIEWIHFCLKSVLIKIQSNNISDIKVHNLFKDYPEIIFYIDAIMDSEVIKLFENVSGILYEIIRRDCKENSRISIHSDSMLIAVLLVMLKNNDFENFLNTNVSNEDLNRELFILRAISDSKIKTPFLILHSLYGQEVALTSIVKLLETIGIDPIEIINLAYKQWTEKIPLPSMDEITDFYTNVRPLISFSKEKKKSTFNTLYLNNAGIELLKLVSVEYQISNIKNNQSRLLSLLQLVDFIIILDSDNKITSFDLEPVIKYTKVLLNDIRKTFRQKSNGHLDSPYFSTIKCATNVVGRTSGKWQGLKPLISSFRFLPELALPSNLDASGKFIESDYYRFPHIIQSFLMYGVTEENGLDIRRNLANDLIKKLKPKKRGNNKLKQGTRNLDTTKSSWDGFDESINEPDPLWRYAYIRAIRDLGVNSDGKGHYFSTVLARVAQSDKSSRVKEQAEKVVQGLQSYRTGVAPGKKRDKTRLLEAWWWLRYAHVLFHEGQIDKEGSEKIRISEIR